MDKHVLTVFLAVLMPLATGISLGLFAYKLWSSSASKEREGGDLNLHNDRIYKDFEFFIKVFLAVGAGFGYVKLNTAWCNAHPLAVVLAVVGMISMCALAISVICHQASKIQRWKQPLLNEWWQWQEVWMVVAMYLLGSSLWVVAIL